MYYLHEKNNSKWKYKRYFDSLSQDNSNHVVLWEQEHRDVLKASWLSPHIENLQKVVAADFDVLQKEMPAQTRGDFTLQDYKEAWVFADQHLHAIQKEGYATHALVPFLNYLNYNDDTGTVTQFDSERNGLRVIAARAIRRGEEVCLRGTGTGNDYFLMKKGAVQPGKPTRLPFRIELSQQDPMWQQKSQAMGVGGGKPGARVFHLSSNLNDPQFMEYVHFLRYFLWTGTPAELKALRAAEIARKQAGRIPFTEETAFLGTQCPAGSSKAEAMMWSYIRQSAENRMRTYPVSLEDTKKVLDADRTPEGPKLTPP